MSSTEVPQEPLKSSCDSVPAETEDKALELARRRVSAAELVKSTLYNAKSSSVDKFYTINEMEFRTPLMHHGSQDTETITVTVRAVLSEAKGADCTDTVRRNSEIKLDFSKPIAAYLVGGPGSDNPPTANPALNDFYLEKGFQILYMDYRGTGSSHELRADQLDKVFTKGVEIQKECLLANFEGGDEKLAEYLTHFRQDNIVRDLEAVRLFLSGEKSKGTKKNAEQVKLTLIGQSYGGWVAFSYLSFYPNALDMVLVTGGVPPIGKTAETVYRQTFTATINANYTFYEKNPGHGEIARKVVEWVETNTTGGNHIQMPGGGHLTTGRFLCLGRTLGTTGGYKKVAKALNECLADITSLGKLSDETLKNIEGWIRFEERVLYCVLQEAIYTDIGCGPSGWAAEKVARELPEFSWLNDGKLPAGNITFYAEHVFNFHYDQFKSLKHLRGAANILAKKDDWAPLFDLVRLRKNKVPIASLCYKNDIFIDAELSEKTKKATTSICQEVDETLMHTAVKDMSGKVLPRLWRILGDAVADSKGIDRSGVLDSDRKNAATLLACISR
ncbi:proline iminopeptidase [Ophiostoma piceae UAMH 11346]|uniref:Proline iminopeptidase n=1 Tax=Ophiostoma piceae (strain UAMH 11346) TaxID=1262450 RepID=S3BSJ0_OPHP1|nr:proline iminopeptidase [Ophiostoma piceae UAMH 11346]